MLKIKEFRLKRELTQDELAKRTGIPKRTLTDYESGKSDITVKKLLKISEILNCNIWDLIDLGKVLPAEKLKELENISDLQNLSFEEQNKVLRYELKKAHDFIISVQASQISSLEKKHTELKNYVYDVANLIKRKWEGQNVEKLRKEIIDLDSQNQHDKKA